MHTFFQSNWYRGTINALKFRSNCEKAIIRATRVRRTVTKVTMQEDILLTLSNLSMKVERRLTRRLLHRKREVASKIYCSSKWIRCLSRRSECEGSAQRSIALSLCQKDCYLRYLLCCLISHGPIIRSSNIESVLLRLCWSSSDTRILCRRQEI